MIVSQIDFYFMSGILWNIFCRVPYGFQWIWSFPVMETRTNSFCSHLENFKGHNKGVRLLQRALYAAFVLIVVTLRLLCGIELGSGWGWLSECTYWTMTLKIVGVLPERKVEIERAIFW